MRFFLVLEMKQLGFCNYDVNRLSNSLSVLANEIWITGHSWWNTIVNYYGMVSEVLHS